MSWPNGEEGEKGTADRPPSRIPVPPSLLHSVDKRNRNGSTHSLVGASILLILGEHWLSRSMLISIGMQV